MESSETGGTPHADASSRPKIPRTRAPTNYPLPSERFGFSDHFEVLRRFALVTANGSKAVAALEVGGGNVPKYAPMLNTGFLCDVGLLSEEGRGHFKPTPEALRFLTTRSASEDRARPILRALIESKWFAEAARSYLQMNPVVSETDLVSDLAIVAQTDMKRKERAIRVLVDYLVFAGIVARTEQGLVLGSNGSSTPSVPPASPAAAIPQFSGAEQARAAQPNQPPDTSGWETIQTNDFFLRIRAKPSVVSWLRKHLDLLEQKLKESDSASADGSGATSARSE
jgi:hypothetical protein